MIPRLAHFEVREEVSLYVTTDGVVGVLLEAPFIDQESGKEQELLGNLQAWLKTLSPEVLIRFLRSSECGKEEDTPANRSAFSEITFVKHKLLIAIEHQGSRGLASDIANLVGFKRRALESRIRVVLESFKSFVGYGFEPVVLPEAEVREHFFWARYRGFHLNSSSIDVGSELLGCLRLRRQVAHELNVSDVGRRLAALPSGVQVSVTIQKMEPARRELLLRSKLKQEGAGEGLVSEIKAEGTEETLKATFLEGAELYEMELLVIVGSLSQEGLRSVLSEAQDSLRLLGDMAIETYGCLPSIASCQLGAPQHVSLLELDEPLMAFIPILKPGPSRSQQRFSPSALILQREDESLDSVDLFASEHMNANAVVIGSSGTGKSVLTGLLTTSLLNEPSVRVIKVDVGGSHSKECEILGGEEYTFSHNVPSGLNPFAEASRVDEKTGQSVLSGFVEVLVRESGEDVLPKSVKSEIEENIKEYLKSGMKPLSLTGFLESTPNFTRAKALRRWSEGGFYGTAFSGEHSKPINRLRYFNFSQIFQAGDAEYAKGIMSAVMAQFNLELVSFPTSRVVFICDEVPFFISECFDLFKISMANVRKYGGSVVLIVQSSQQLVRGDENGRGDTALIDLAYHRFLYSIDGNHEVYRERFGLSGADRDRLKALETSLKARREVLYQVGRRFKKMTVRLSAEEYWRVTSSHQDRLKFKRVRELVPELSTLEAIQLLSHFKLDLERVGIK